MQTRVLKFEISFVGDPSSLDYGSEKENKKARSYYGQAITLPERHSIRMRVSYRKDPIYVAVVGEVVVGAIFAISSPTPSDSGGFYYDIDVVVAPMFRRKGIATALVTAFEGDFGDLEDFTDRLAVEAQCVNEASAALFEKLGYELIISDGRTKLYRKVLWDYLGGD